MGLNSIANLTYINQASSATSALQANNMPQAPLLNHALFHEQMQKVEEVRPTEETHKTEDREGSAKREFDEGKDGDTQKEKNFKKTIEETIKKTTQEERAITEDEMLMRPEIHLLDVKG